MTVNSRTNIPASFRDPSGSLFLEEGVLYRQINPIGKDDFDQLISSGLYKALAENSWLIKHEQKENRADGYVIKPELISFISYPYEWCFGQLKDAALLTLKIQKKALEYGMYLKDASAYNIQFKNDQPILIDTLSFEKYEEGSPWFAYRQFCQHFLAPLALMAYKDIRLSQLLRIYIDGIPLDLASSLLPRKTWFRFSILSHIHLHARTQNYFSDKAVNSRKYNLSKRNLLALVSNLESLVQSLKWKPRGTEWGEYYTFTNYSSDSFSEKEKLVEKMIEETKPKTVWDLGANTGLFSRLASRKDIMTLSFDNDYAAVEKNYREVVAKKEKNILPLISDLTNPSSGLGWSHEERMSLQSRGPADLALALALIHHLAISNNLPFFNIAKFFSKISNSLVIEFVPKADSQVQKLLKTRKDIFENYNQDCFEKEFSKFFHIKQRQKLSDSERTLYLMEKLHE